MSMKTLLFSVCGTRGSYEVRIIHAPHWYSFGSPACTSDQYGYEYDYEYEYLTTSTTTTTTTSVPLLYCTGCASRRDTVIDNCISCFCRIDNKDIATFAMCTPKISFAHFQNKSINLRLSTTTLIQSSICITINLLHLRLHLHLRIHLHYYTVPDWCGRTNSPDITPCAKYLQPVWQSITCLHLT